MPKTSTATYHAEFSLDPSGQWLAELKEVPQVHTFGRTLGKAREYLVDALALWLNAPADEVRGQIDFEQPALPEEVRDAVDRALAEKEIAESITRAFRGQVAQAAKALVDDAHLSLRDAAEILGISHQRVQQLVSGDTTPAQGLVEDVKAPDDLVSALREFLPGGTKEDLGKLAVLALAGLAVAWLETRSRG